MLENKQQSQETALPNSEQCSLGHIMHKTTVCIHRKGGEQERV